MEEIRIVQKPDWISWDEIQKCIYESQQTNTKKGFDMLFGHSTGQQLQDKIGEGYCYVALNEDNKVVGTISLKVETLNFWWHKGKAGLQCYEGILPQYRGSEVYFDLHDTLEKKEKELDLKVIWATTAEQNAVVIKLQKKLGWKIVQYSSMPKKGPYFSVFMVKWVDECPYSDRYINLMYSISKKIVRLKYKVTSDGKKRRFPF